MEYRSTAASSVQATAALPAGEQALVNAAAMFRALADPERLRLLVRLAAGEASVSDLAGGHKLTTVSARLKLLLAARLVRRRREARQIFYALADQHVIDLVANAMDHVSERHEPTHRHHLHTEGKR
jgi:ArsR family transcriptional regulator